MSASRSESPSPTFFVPLGAREATIKERGWIPLVDRLRKSSFSATEPLDGLRPIGLHGEEVRLGADEGERLSAISPCCSSAMNIRRTHDMTGWGDNISCCRSTISKIVSARANSVKVEKVARLPEGNVEVLARAIGKIGVLDAVLW